MRGLVKSVFPSGWAFGDPVVSLVEVHSRGVDRDWLKKRAASDVFAGVDVRPKPGHSYLHILALGNADSWGGNRNGDIFFRTSKDVTIPFPKEGAAKVYCIKSGNRDRYKTFETHAHVYSRHRNGDPALKDGDVVKAAHNDDMDRVELLTCVRDDRWGDDIQKVANGGNLPTSMSARVPHDVCTVCGNVAKSRRNYCEHARNQMAQLAKDGTWIGVMNEDQTFFDISRVRNNADRTSWALRKAAGLEDISGLPGAELSEALGIGWSPQWRPDLLRKLAAIEKTLPGVVTGLGIPGGCVIQDLPDAALSGLMPFDSDAVLGQLADAKIVLSLRDFVKLLTRGEVSEGLIGAADRRLEGVYGRVCENGAEVPGLDLDSQSEIPLPAPARQLISSLVPMFGLASAPVVRRVTITVLRPTENYDTSAGDDDGAEKVAQMYGIYKAAALERAAGSAATDSGLTRLAVLDHYLRKGGR